MAKQQSQSIYTFNDNYNIDFLELIQKYGYYVTRNKQTATPASTPNTNPVPEANNAINTQDHVEVSGENDANADTA